MEYLLVSFRYRRGDTVQCATRYAQPYVVVQQRYTVRDSMSPVVEYLLRHPSGQFAAFWALEPDVVPAEEEPPCPNP